MSSGGVPGHPTGLKSLVVVGGEEVEYGSLKSYAISADTSDVGVLFLSHFVHDYPKRSPRFAECLPILVMCRDLYA